MTQIISKKTLSLLIVTADLNEANILGMGLQDALGESLSSIFIETNRKDLLGFYERVHPDVVIFYGFNASYSEATTIQIRSLEGARHAGIIVMAEMDEAFDELALKNYGAGADDVVSARTSIAVLKLKITTVFAHKRAADELRKSIYKLQTINQTDELTGLANMRGFLKKFGTSLKYNQDGLGSVAVIMMDLDHFKRVNDTMNHMVGSFVIKSVGHLLGQNSFFAKGDFAARYGGDEYIIVLHGSDPLAMMAKADGVRRLIEQKKFCFQGYTLSVTCSMGLCWVPAKFVGRPEDLVKSADAMLYQSKNAGRNKVTGMTLRYPIDFNHIGRTHLINWDTSRDDDRVARRNKA